jgi:hypothetical protein
MYRGVPSDVPASVSVAFRSFAAALRGAQRLGDSEIGHRGGAAGEQDVMRLDVPVHDAALVCVSECARRRPS